MTDRLYPSNPTFQSEAERLVWERLRDTLPGDAILLANQRLTDEVKDHEADLIVMLPQAGIVVLEVKGGSVWFKDGQWWQSGKGQRVIEPVDQARDAKYAFQKFVQDRPEWSRGGLVWAHGVVTPYSSFPDDFAAPDCPRWALHDRDDVGDLVGRLIKQCHHQAQGKKVPSHDDIEMACEVLRGRTFTRHDLNAEAAERQSVADRLSQEQAMILRVTRLLNRVEIRGGAGSGKTVLALAQTRELASGRGREMPQRVALLCYSYGLGTFLARQAASWPRHQRPAFVGTYEEFARHLGVTDFGQREDSDFWEQDLPRQMAELAGDLPPEKRFDAFVVDESQDFADDWWTPLLRSMADPEESGLYAYSDEHQRIFARFGQPPVPLVPLVLDDNLRNTKQIHEAFSPLAPTRMTSRGGDGVDVHYLPCTAEDGEALADEAVEILLDAGWSPGNIALLTTWKRHPVQVSEVDRLGQVGYMKTWWDDDEVFYGHVLGCKGLERAAVVLWVNDERTGDRDREKLYVGMSRATDQLIVVGEPDVVRAMGGPAVAARLGL